MKPVTEPASFRLHDPADALDVLGRVTNFLDGAGLHPIEHALEHRARRLPDDNENSSGDEQADNRVCERVAKPNTGRPGYDGKAGQTVRACMITIDNESSAIDLPSNSNAEHRHGL